MSALTKTIKPLCESQDIIADTGHWPPLYVKFLDANVLSHVGLVQSFLSSYLLMGAAQLTHFQGLALSMLWMAVLHLAPQASRQ